MIEKVVPVVLHPSGAPLRVLAFRHPQAGLQIVKGTLAPGEHPLRGAARELEEESGLQTVSATPIMVRDDIADGQRWHFALTRVRHIVPERFKHYCQDDGGHVFEFFWHPLDGPRDGFRDWYVKALDALQDALV